MSTAIAAGARILANPYASISVDQPHCQFNRQFANPKEVADWAKGEIEFWRHEIEAANTKLRQQNVAENLITPNQFSELEVLHSNAVDEHRRAATAPSDRIIEYCEKVELGISSGTILVRDSTVGDRLLQIKEKNPLGFASALALSEGQPVTIPVGRGQSLFSMRALLDGYRTRYPVRVEEFDAKSKALAVRMDEVSALHESAQRTLDQTMELQKTLSQKIATEGAVAVWARRSSSHAWAYRSLFVAISATFALLGLLLLKISDLLVPGAALGWIAALSSGDILKPWLYGVVFGVPIFGGLWVIRMLTGLYRANLAQANDARERVAMVKTLYALHTEQKTAPNEAERMLVVNALFRPAPGSDHDPSLPNTLLEHMVKMATKDAGRG